MVFKIKSISIEGVSGSATLTLKITDPRKELGDAYEYLHNKINERSQPNIKGNQTSRGKRLRKTKRKQ